MKVFLSWSGPRSQHVAEAVRNWLPKVLQAVKPWMSDEDIGMGTRWSAEIAAELEDSKVGIICLTPENQHNPWVMFEVGALSKTIEQTYVCPYLFNLSASELSGPTAQFQAAVADKDGTSRILQTLNRALGESQLLPEQLQEIFDVWWPKLESDLERVPPNDQTQNTRSSDEILEEVLRNTREQLRREEIRLAGQLDNQDGMRTVITTLQDLIPYLSQLKEIPTLTTDIFKSVADDRESLDMEHLPQLETILSKLMESPPQLEAMVSRMMESHERETLRIQDTLTDSESESSESR